MISLEDLGFTKGIIFETIVSTYTKQGHPNIAPMGVIKLDTRKILIKIYRSSNTFKNLKSKRCAVVNVSKDATLFYKSAIKENNIDNNVSKDLFEKGEIVDAPLLKKADATMEALVWDIKNLDSERAEVVLEVKKIKSAGCLPKVYNRAFSATIESIILATRIKLFLVGNQLQKKQAKKMIEKVMWFKEIIRRTAPKSEYENIISDLIEKIKVWKKNK